MKRASHRGTRDQDDDEKEEDVQFGDEYQSNLLSFLCTEYQFLLFLYLKQKETHKNQG